MSGDPDSGDGDAPRPRVSLFGRATKPALKDPAPRDKPPRKPRRMGLSSLSGLLTFVLLGALATVGGLAWLMKEARSPGPLTEDKVIMIAREDDAATIAEQLERAGVIDSATWFNILTALDGNRGALKRGEYAFKAGMTMNDVENELIAHRVVRYKLTIPEGLTSEQVVDRLREDSVLTGDVREPPREGSLMPDTYYFERGDTRQSILSRMAKVQTKAVEDIWKARSPDLPIKSPWEMVTLASIVEKETAKPDERPRVAGVFINRLDKHMRLGSDPTIVYGLVQGKGTLGRSITKADLNQSTPYNTYIIDGLPPGPICNPGKAALEAVANPARSKDLYFVADGTGGHAFSETLDQHNKNVARWRQIEKDVKDKLSPDVTGPAIRGSIDAVDPSQFGALVSPGQGQAPPSILARLSKIGTARNAKDAALASLSAPGVKTMEELGFVVSGVNDGPAEGFAFGNDDPPATGGTGPIASAPLSPAMLADQKAREAKYGTGTLTLASTTLADTAGAAAPAQASYGTASGRPRIYDASEGTALDPLRNKTYDLSYAKVVPADTVLQK
ncbi:MAG TPA: endolytic transglycosylase MltG [Roseiarcus sp.]